jgi:hypothetical protein
VATLPRTDDDLGVHFLRASGQKDDAYLGRLSRDAVLYQALNESLPPVPIKQPAENTPSSAQIKQMVYDEAVKRGVPPALAVAVATQESGLRARPGDGGARDLARGVFQLTPAAAIDAGIDPTSREDLAFNIQGGVTFLGQKLRETGGNIDQALRRYNGGGDPNYVANVRRFLRDDIAAAPKFQGVQADLAEKAQKLFDLARREGYDLQVRSGYRTVAEQTGIAARSTIAAAPGRSQHNIGAALDVRLLKDGQRIEDRAAWQKIGEMGESLGLRWGGRFRKYDPMHFDLGLQPITPTMLSQAQTAVQGGGVAPGTLPDDVRQEGIRLLSQVGTIPSLSAAPSRRAIQGDPLRPGVTGTPTAVLPLTSTPFDQPAQRTQAAGAPTPLPDSIAQEALALANQPAPSPPRLLPPVLRQVQDFTRGVYNAAGSLFRTPDNVLEYFSFPDEIRALTRPLADLGAAAQRSAKASDIPESHKTFIDKLFEGAGSMATYAIPALFTGGTATPATITTTGLGNWALSKGLTAMTITESVGEANEAYEGLRDLVGIDEAGKRASKILGINVALLGITNAAGFGNEVSRPLLKILAQAGSEGAQESLQYTAQNSQFWVPANHPKAASLQALGWKEADGKVYQPFSISTAAEVGLIGAILGGGVGVAQVGAQALQSGAATQATQALLDKLPEFQGARATITGRETSSEFGGVPLPATVPVDGGRLADLTQRLNTVTDILETERALPDTPPERIRSLEEQQRTLAQEIAANAPPIERFQGEALTPEVRKARTAGMIASGVTRFEAFRERGKDLLEGLSYADELKTWNDGKQYYKEQVSKLSTKLPSTGRLLEIYAAGQDTADWYTDARAELWGMFGTDADVVARLIAAFSPRTTVNRNIALALEAYAQWKSGEDIAPRGSMATHMSNMQRALNGEQLSGSKVQRFLANILGDKTPATIDMWMMEVFGLNRVEGADERAPTINQYRMAEEWTRQLANQAGVSPSEMQAALWVGAKLWHGPAIGELEQQISQPLRKRIQEAVAKFRSRLEDLSPTLQSHYRSLDTQGQADFDIVLALGRAVAGGLAGCVIGNEDDCIQNALLGAGLGFLSGRASARLFKQLAGILRASPAGFRPRQTGYLTRSLHQGVAGGERGAVPLPEGHQPDIPLQQRIADLEDVIEVARIYGDPTQELEQRLADWRGQLETIAVSSEDAARLQETGGTDVPGEVSQEEAPQPTPTQAEQEVSGDVIDAVPVAVAEPTEPELSPLVEEDYPPAERDDFPQQPAPPVTTPRRRRMPTIREAAQGLTPETFRDQHGRWKIPLKDMPPTELELQDFIRQQGGIRLTTEQDVPGELRALITRKETGIYRLENNASGKSLEQMAQLASELGFPAGPEKTEFLEMLSLSVEQGRQVYSLSATGGIPLVDDPFLAEAYAHLLDVANTLEARTITQRRADTETGTRPRARVREEAAAEIASGQFTTADVVEILPGTALNDVEAAKVVLTMESLAQNLLEKSRTLVGIPSNQQSVAVENEFVQALALIGELEPVRLGVLAELGRSLGILNDPLSSYNQRLNFIHQALKRSDISARVLAQKFLAYEKNYPALIRAAKSMETAAEQDTFLENWVVNLFNEDIGRSPRVDMAFTQAMQRLPDILRPREWEVIQHAVFESRTEEDALVLTEDERGRLAGVLQYTDAALLLGQDRAQAWIEQIVMNSTPEQAARWAPVLVEWMTPGQLKRAGAPLVGVMTPAQIRILAGRRPDVLRSIVADQMVFGEEPHLIDVLSAEQLEALGDDILLAIAGNITPTQLDLGIRDLLQEEREQRALALHHLGLARERHRVRTMGTTLADTLTSEQLQQLGGWAFLGLPDERQGVYQRQITALLDAAERGRGGYGARPLVRERVAQSRALIEGEDTEQTSRDLSGYTQQLRERDVALRPIRARQDAASIAESLALPGLEDLQRQALRSMPPERWYLLAPQLLRSMTPEQLREHGATLLGQMGRQDIEELSMLQIAQISTNDQLELIRFEDTPLRGTMQGLLRDVNISQVRQDVLDTLTESQLQRLPAQAREVLEQVDIDANDMGRIAPTLLLRLTNRQLLTLFQPLFMTLNARQVDHLSRTSSLFDRMASQTPDAVPVERHGPRTPEEAFRRQQELAQAGVQDTEMFTQPDTRFPELTLELSERGRQEQLPGMPGPPTGHWKTHLGGMLLEQWIQGLLSPITLSVNLMGGALVPPLRLLQSGLAGIISQSPLGSGEIPASTVIAQIQAMGEGIMNGWKIGLKALRTNQEQFETAYHLQQAGTRNMVDLPRDQATQSKNVGIDPDSMLGKAFDFWATWIGALNGGRTITRGMMATDEMAKSVMFMSNMTYLAHLDAKAKGMTFEQAKQHADWALHHPSADDIRQAAYGKTLVDVFQQAVGTDRPIAGMVAALANWAPRINGIEIPFMRVVIPFPRASTNLPKFAIDNSPLMLATREFWGDVFGGDPNALTWAEVQAGRAPQDGESVRGSYEGRGAKRDMALARLTLAGLSAGAFAYMAAQGILTGRGPDDQEMRRALESTGWRPYSVKIGNYFFSYNRFDPITTVIGSVADFVQIQRESHNPDIVGRIAGGIVYGLAKNIASRTYLENLANFMDIMTPRLSAKAEDIITGLGRWAKHQIGSLAPWPLRMGRKLSDPYARYRDPLIDEVSDLLDGLYQNTPGWGPVRGSLGLPYDRDIYGDVRLMGWGFGPEWLARIGQAFSPVSVSKLKDSPIDQELVRNNILLGLPRRTLGVHAITPENLDQAVQNPDPLAERNLTLTPHQLEAYTVFAAGNTQELLSLADKYHYFDNGKLADLIEAKVGLLNFKGEKEGIQPSTPPGNDISLREFLNWAVTTPQWSALQSWVGPGGAKEQFVRNVVHGYRELGKEQFLLREPELAGQLKLAKDVAELRRQPTRDVAETANRLGVTLAPRKTSESPQPAGARPGLAGQ